MIRNLICHVYPRRAGQKWRRTAEHLLQRRDLFNGRRILTVATDETTDALPIVKRAFAGLDAEIISYRNCSLQESRTFLPAMDMIASTNPDEITFRCHTKGCTHAADDHPSHVWADVMFSTCLDFPELIDSTLATSAICGSFRGAWLWPFPGINGWYFAGSCYWLKHDRTFTRNWRWLMPNFYAIEAWPGIFQRDESACLFHDGTVAHVGALDLYNPEYWRRGIIPQFEAWREQMESTTARKAWIPEDSLLRKELV